MRARNEPHFRWKSLVLVFGLQATLAWVVSLSAFGAASEAVADLQLTRFKVAQPIAGRSWIAACGVPPAIPTTLVNSACGGAST